jgi:hypothetical protein
MNDALETVITFSKVLTVDAEKYSATINQVLFHWSSEVNLFKNTRTFDFYLISNH